MGDDRRASFESLLYLIGALSGFSKDEMREIISRYPGPKNWADGADVEAFGVWLVEQSRERTE